MEGEKHNTAPNTERTNVSTFNWVLLVDFPARPQLTASKLSKDQQLGNPLTIHARAKVLTQLRFKFYMRLRVQLAGGKKMRPVRVLQFPALLFSIWLDKLRMKSTRKSISQHVISCNYVMITERPWIIRLFIVTDVVRPIAKHDCLPLIFSLVCIM